MLWVLRDLAGKQLMGNLAPTWHLHTPSDSDHHIQHHIDQHIDHKYCIKYVLAKIIYSKIMYWLSIYNSHLIDNCTGHHIYHHASYIIYHVLLPINAHITCHMAVTDFNQIKVTQPTPSVELRCSTRKPQLTYTSHKTAWNLISKWNSIVAKAPS